MAVPGEAEWRSIAEEFEERSNFPGALDGKHVKLRAPPNSSPGLTHNGSFKRHPLLNKEHNFLELVISNLKIKRLSSGH